MKKFYEASIVGYEAEDGNHVYIISGPAGEQHVSTSINDMTDALCRSIVDRVLDGPADPASDFGDNISVDDFMAGIADFLAADEGSDEECESLETVMRFVKRSVNGVSLRDTDRDNRH